MNQNITFLKISLFFVLIFVIFSTVCISQTKESSSRVTVSVEKFNILYLNLDNPVSIAVDGYAPEQIYVSSSSDCNLKGENGTYTVKPLGTRGGGRALALNINVISKDKDTTFLEQKIFGIRRIPYPIPFFGSRRGGLIGKKQIEVVNFISARVDLFPFKLKHRVTSFKMIIQPETGKDQTYIAKSHLLTPEMKEALEKVNKGDKLMFLEIKSVTLQDDVVIAESNNMMDIILIVK